MSIGLRTSISAVRATIASLGLLALATPSGLAQPAPPIWTVPEIGTLPDDANGRQVRRGRDLGVKNMIVTHGLTTVPGLSMAQAKEVTGMGAVIEVCYLQFLAGPNAPMAFLTHWQQVGAKQVAQAVKELGAKSLVISSDLGQAGEQAADLHAGEAVELVEHLLAGRGEPRACIR